MSDPKNPHGYKHKMVDGVLVELTKAEIAELLARDEAAAKEQAKAEQPETKQQERTHERGGSQRR